MSDYLHLLISVTVLLGLGSFEPVFDITDPAFIEECVREHNKHRADVTPTAANMRYMTWDEGLAETARAWARFCLFEHNIYLREVRRIHPTFTSVGENIWAGAPYSLFKPESAVKLWKDEDQDYNYDTDQCTKVCGHYTQIVWADSYKVGCAAQACPNGVAETTFSTKPGIIFVCNYATALFFTVILYLSLVILFFFFQNSAFTSHNSDSSLFFWNSEFIFCNLNFFASHNFDFRI
uniref:GLIPR1-like protein 1 n=1 Tax=Sinocyclocheilus rhinocerous TaxID=307959 RepID=A0A673KYH0_9TELE